jgi:hypothetical protein
MVSYRRAAAKHAYLGLTIGLHQERTEQVVLIHVYAISLAKSRRRGDRHTGNGVECDQRAGTGVVLVRALRLLVSRTYFAALASLSPRELAA